MLVAMSHTATVTMKHTSSALKTIIYKSNLQATDFSFDFSESTDLQGWFGIALHSTMIVIWMLQTSGITWH